MITACVIFYNDQPLLEECLKSLKNVNIVAIDGAFTDFPHDKPYSTDGSLEVAKKYADVVVETDIPWATQVDKRNEYLKYVPDGDTVIVIDADEELWGNIPHGGNHKVYIQPESNPTGYWWARMFTKTPGFRHYKTHMTYADNTGLINHEDFKPLGVTIYHKNLSRPDKRYKDKEIYRKIHNEREMADRERLLEEMK